MILLRISLSDWFALTCMETKSTVADMFSWHVIGRKLNMTMTLKSQDVPGNPTALLDAFLLDVVRVSAHLANAKERFFGIDWAVFDVNCSGVSACRRETSNCLQRR